MSVRTTSVILCFALATPSAALAATGGATAPPAAPAPQAPPPTLAPQAPPPTPAPLAPTPEAAVRQAAPPQQPAPVPATPAQAPIAPPRTPTPQAPPAPVVDAVTAARTTTPLRATTAIAARAGDAEDPDVVGVPIPAEPAPAEPAAAVQLPRTGFDIGLMIATGLVMISAGLIITAVLVPAPPVPAVRRRVAC